jgi:hypothetical protein
LFERETMETLARRFLQLFESIAADPSQSLSNLRLLGEDETEGRTPESFGRVVLSRKDFEELILEMGEGV